MSFTDKARDSMEIDPCENRTSFAVRYAGRKLVGSTPLADWTQQILSEESLLDTNSPEHAMFRQTLQDLPDARFQAANALKLMQINPAIVDRAAIVEKLVHAYGEFQEALTVLRQKRPDGVATLADIDARAVGTNYMQDLEAGAKLYDAKKNQIPGLGV